LGFGRFVGGWRQIGGGKRWQLGFRRSNLGLHKFGGIVDTSQRADYKLEFHRFIGGRDYAVRREFVRVGLDLHELRRNVGRRGC
jgi:hypothetical protein